MNAPFELRKGEDLTLRVFLDENLVEVFANDRQAAVAADAYVPENLGISLFSKGGDSVVKRIIGWPMRSIHSISPSAAVRTAHPPAEAPARWRSGH